MSTGVVCQSVVQELPYEVRGHPAFNMTTVKLSSYTDGLSLAVLNVQELFYPVSQYLTAQPAVYRPTLSIKFILKSDGMPFEKL